MARAEAKYAAQVAQAFAEANAGKKGPGKSKTNLVNATCHNPDPITNDHAELVGSYQVGPSNDVTQVPSILPLGGRCTQIAPNIECYILAGNGCSVTMCAANYVPFVQGAYPGIWVPRNGAPTISIKEEVCHNITGATEN